MGLSPTEAGTDRFDFSHWSLSLEMILKCQQERAAELERDVGTSGDN